MKLAIVIISNNDLSKVISATSNEGFFSTRISTSGLFLEKGNTTLLFGIEDDKVEKLFDVVEENVTKRVVKKMSVESTVEGSLLNTPVDVEEYGAVAFVINVEDFRRL